MGPLVIDIRSTEDPLDATHRAVEMLAAGNLVAFPTETVYGLAASALCEEAVNKLLAIKSRMAQHPFTLAVKSAEEALDYVPDICPLGRRLARRCWPGPITLVLDGTSRDSILTRLPQIVQKSVMPNGTVGLRVPAHPVALEAMRLLPGPLVLTSANRGGQTPAVDGLEVAEKLGDEVGLVVHDGKCRFGQPSTVAQVTNGNISILRQGVLDESTIKRLSDYLVIIVCTGNTCRSPMGEILLKQKVAKSLGCEISEIQDKGISILSAGIAAMPGGKPSRESVEVMKSNDLDITCHESQPLTERMVQHADLILTMTRGHKMMVLSQWPDATSRTHVLSQSNTDVSDPIGGPIEVYKSCAEQIDSYLNQWVEHIIKKPS